MPEGPLGIRRPRSGTARTSQTARTSRSTGDMLQGPDATAQCRSTAAPLRHAGRRAAGGSSAKMGDIDRRVGSRSFGGENRAFTGAKIARSALRGLCTGNADKWELSLPRPCNCLNRRKDGDTSSAAAASEPLMGTRNDHCCRHGARRPIWTKLKGVTANHRCAPCCFWEAAGLPELGSSKGGPAQSRWLILRA